MRRRMTRRQWRKWQKFFEDEPWGSAHEDLRFGYLLSLLHAAHYGKHKAPGDWFPSLRVLPKPLPPEVQAAQWKASCIARGGKVIERK
jgi:hypothetical protein